ncbi:hypothetical protein L6164_027876 [Bauhinia variegata]|uniref:Uncharacterized protein n=1 Tax=Bauhinia variegata TaxID=167791 RepID=A0ACB9LUP3_BAUVA|nr:hypothetical protein L6164_027876 [Bauhinia variegata]
MSLLKRERMEEEEEALLETKKLERGSMVEVCRGSGGIRGIRKHKDREKATEEVKDVERWIRFPNRAPNN